jgi:glucose/arabinose dehydrogenase
MTAARIGIVARPAAILTIAALALVGCAAQEDEPTELAPAPSGSLDPAAAGPVEPVGEQTVIASGFDVPWSIVRLENGSTLISERDTTLVKEVTASGQVREVGAVPGVEPGGEGGLLGLATLDMDAAEAGAADGNDADADDAETDGAAGGGLWLYAYITAEADNRVIRMPLLGDPGALALGDPEVVLTGIEKAGNHNGGRIAFGPDGMLYATTGDAGDTARSQDPDSLSGKILRMTPEGAVPADNPNGGSLVYTLGHRNPQGIAWEADGTMWAAEFGQNTWDELNLITPGANYGWPEVEGQEGVEGFVDPVLQWATSEASPSGLASTRDTLFLAALRGQRVWTIDPATSEAIPYFQGQYGRIRDVTAGPDGTLWMITNNTGGRGLVSENDDLLVEVRLAPRGAR